MQKSCDSILLKRKRSVGIGVAMPTDLIKLRPVLFMVVLLVVSLAVPRMATACWVKFSSQELFDKSDVILIGDIIGPTGEDEQKWATFWDVKAYCYLKGNQDSSNFTVGTPGVENKSKSMSTDYRLDSWGSTVLLFLRKKEGFYETISPQGIVSLKRTKHCRKTGEPLNGQIILREFEIADPKISQQEKSEIEKLVLKNSQSVTPVNAARSQATNTEKFSAEKGVVIFLMTSVLAIGGIRFVKRRSEIR